MEYLYGGTRTHREVSAVDLWTILVAILIVCLIVFLVRRI